MANLIYPNENYLFSETPSPHVRPGSLFVSALRAGVCPFQTGHRAIALHTDTCRRRTLHLDLGFNFLTGALRAIHLRTSFPCLPKNAKNLRCGGFWFSG